MKKTILTFLVFLLCAVGTAAHADVKIDGVYDGGGAEISRIPDAGLFTVRGTADDTGVPAQVILVLSRQKDGASYLVNYGTFYGCFNETFEITLYAPNDARGLEAYVIVTAGGEIEKIPLFE